MKRSAAISNSFDPRVDLYIAQAPKFAQPILTHVRELVHKASPGIEESIKWGRPFFTHRGVVIGNMAAFTRHCSFGFWGAEMAAVLLADGISRKESSGSFGRLTLVKDLPADKVLLEYLKQAIGLAEDSKTSKPPSKQRAPKGDALPPPELVAALEVRPVAKTNFAQLSLSCQREYIEWIEEARRPETRERRIAATLNQVSEGKGLHGKYA